MQMVNSMHNTVEFKVFTISCILLYFLQYNHNVEIPTRMPVYFSDSVAGNHTNHFKTIWIYFDNGSCSYVLVYRGAKVVRTIRVPN